MILLGDVPARCLQRVQRLDGTLLYEWPAEDSTSTSFAIITVSGAHTLRDEVSGNRSPTDKIQKRHRIFRLICENVVNLNIYHQTKQKQRNK